MTDSTVTASRREVAAHALTLLPQVEQSPSFESCSMCLGVRDGSRWIDAEAAIRSSRSFEHDSAPRLQPGLCDQCADAIALRRAHTPIARAA
jgi:hypothetical protein